MGGSRRKYKKSKPKVRVGLPKKNPNVFKPAFSLPPKLRSLLPHDPNWDGKASVIQNYKSFGVVSNPNLLGVRSRTSHIIETESLQVPHPSLEPEAAPMEQDPIASGSDLEEDDLKSALGKQRSDGKSAPPQPLTAMQRLHIGRLIEKYGDDYERMFMDTKLNSMQHSVATLEKLCKSGYMAPEYAVEGLFSVKSDVFSFGVILLEIISGRKNSGFHLTGQAQTLLVYAWKLWNEGKEMEFVDPLLLESCMITQILKCMHIGLLCVQEDPADRPTISKMVVLLEKESIALPKPKQPALSVGRVIQIDRFPISNPAVNDLTVSIPSPR